MGSLLLYYIGITTLGFQLLALENPLTHWRVGSKGCHWLFTPSFHCLGANLGQGMWGSCRWLGWLSSILLPVLENVLICLKEKKKRHQAAWAMQRGLHPLFVRVTIILRRSHVKLAITWSLSRKIVIWITRLARWYRSTRGSQNSYCHWILASRDQRHLCRNS